MNREDEVDKAWEAEMVRYFDQLKAEGKCWSCGGAGFFYGPYTGDELVQSLEDDAPERLRERKHDCSECAGTGRAA